MIIPKKPLNPFVFDNPVETTKFIGRKWLLKQLCQSFSSLDNIAIEADQQTGKTSLLEYLTHIDSLTEFGLDSNHIPAYFNFQKLIQANELTIWQTITQTVVKQLQLRQIETPIIEDFEEITHPIFDSNTSALPFNLIFSEAFQRIKQKGLIIHLLFDEFEQLKDNPHINQHFYTSLRSLALDQTISYLIATRTSITTLENSPNLTTSSFSNIFTTYNLPPFTEDEAHDLIFRYLNDALANKLWNISDFLYEHTGYHPYVLQSLCFNLYQYLQENDRYAWPPTSITQLPTFHHSATEQLNYYWEVSTKHEKELMRKLKKDLEQKSSQTQSNNKRLTKDDLAPLIARALVVPDKNKDGWQFISPLLKDLVHNKTNIITLSTIALPIGTMSTDSNLYINRQADQHCWEYLTSSNAITLYMQAPRQMGKSSLLYRTLSRLKSHYQYPFALIDFQKFPKDILSKPDGAEFFFEFCHQVTASLGLPNKQADYWSGGGLPISKCESYFLNYLIPMVGQLFTLALDEVDRLIHSPLRDSFFGMLRAWHNERVAKTGFENLSLFLVSSIAPSLLIDNLNQSPFNVAQAIILDNFNLIELNQLNQRYQRPLIEEEIPDLRALTGGHPFLSQIAFHYLVTQNQSLKNLQAVATTQTGPFRAHLQGLRQKIFQKDFLKQTLQEIFHDGTYSHDISFFQLETLGVVQETTPKHARVSNDLYQHYFEAYL